MAKQFYLEYFKDAIAENKADIINEIITKAVSSEDLAYLKGAVASIEVINQWFKKQIGLLEKQEGLNENQDF